MARDVSWFPTGPTHRRFENVYEWVPEWDWARDRGDVFRRVAGDDDTAVYEFLPRRAKPAVCRDPMP